MANEVADDFASSSRAVLSPEQGLFQYKGCRATYVLCSESKANTRELTQIRSQPGDAL